MQTGAYGMTENSRIYRYIANEPNQWTAPNTLPTECESQCGVKLISFLLAVARCYCWCCCWCCCRCRCCCCLLLNDSSTLWVAETTAGYASISFNYSCTYASNENNHTPQSSSSSSVVASNDDSLGIIWYFDCTMHARRSPFIPHL